MKRKTYVGIDLLKLILSLFIVFTHTYCYDGGAVGSFISNCISSIGVPFFFIASGFFMSKGFSRCNGKEERNRYCINYLKRVSLMYVIWSVIALPVSIKVINAAHGEYSVLLKVIYYIRSFLLAGSLGVYWYILSLIYLAILFWWANSNSKKLCLYIVGVIFFLFGVVYNAGIISNATSIGHLVHATFGSERNFLMVGLFYSCIGDILSRKVIRVDIKKLFVIFAACLVIAQIEALYSPIHITQAASAITVFLIAIQLKLDNLEPFSGLMRKMSTCIYLVHHPFILLFDFYLRRGTIIDFPLTVLFSVIVGVVIIRCLPKKVSNAVLGK